MVTVDNPEIYAVNVSQGAGALAPAINAYIQIDGALPDASYFDYEAPTLEISIGGISYTCLPLDVAVEIDPMDIGVEIEVQYYPEQLVKLQNTGLRKHLVFLSETEDQWKVLENQYDAEKYEVLHKTCDSFITTGWTIKEIADVIAARAGVSVNLLMPPFHVRNRTVVFKKGQNFLSFLKSLLPPQFSYACSLVGDKVSFLIVLPSHQPLSFVEGCHRMAIKKPGVPAYNYAQIVGGDYLWGTTFSFGSQGKSGVASYPEGKIITETLPEETTATDNGTETIQTERQYKTAPDGTTFFALLSKTVTKKGPYVKDSTPEELTLQIVEKTYTYENENPAVYQTPRQQRVLTTQTSLYTRVTLSQIDDEMYKTYLLTEDGQILTPTEYLDISEENRSDVVLSAYHASGNTQTETEEFEWVSAREADEFWIEGTQRSHVETIRKVYVSINGHYYDAMLSPKELLEAVLSDMNTSATLTVAVTSIANSIWKTAEVARQKLVQLHEQSFQVEQSNSLFNPKTGQLEPQPIIIQPVDGVPQGSPTRFRTARLEIEIEGDADEKGTYGTNKTCIPFFAEIPTNNPVDFEMWAGMLWDVVNTPSRDVSLSSFSRFIPPGTIEENITFFSFSFAKDEQGNQTITLGGTA